MPKNILHLWCWIPSTFFRVWTAPCIRLSHCSFSEICVSSFRLFLCVPSFVIFLCFDSQKLDTCPLYFLSFVVPVLPAFYQKTVKCHASPCGATKQRLLFFVYFILGITNMAKTLKSAVYQQIIFNMSLLMSPDRGLALLSTNWQFLGSVAMYVPCQRQEISSFFVLLCVVATIREIYNSLVWRIHRLFSP